MLIESPRFENVRRAQTPEACDAIFLFRFEVLVHERGWVDYPGVDPAEHLVRSADDEGPGVTHLFTGSLYGRELDAVARLRVFAAGEVPETLRRNYALDRLPGVDELGIAELGMIIAHPATERQANLPIASLFRVAFDQCLEAGAQLLFFAVHPGMVAACGRVMGAQRYGAPAFADHSGPLVPMVIIPSNSEHHERLGSLFAGAAWKHFVLARRPRLDTSAFADRLVDELGREFSADDRWMHFEDRFYRRGVARWSFFDGLREAVIEELLARGRVRSLAVDDELFDEASAPSEMFVVLEGCFEILVGGRSVDVAGEGELIGEISVLSPAPSRTANVRALMRSRVLGFDQGALRSMTFGDPEAGYQVMFNLARFVAERFRERVRIMARLEKALEEKGG